MKYDLVFIYKKIINKSLFLFNKMMVFLTFFIYEKNNKYTNLTVDFFSLINPNRKSKYSLVEVTEIQNIKSAKNIHLFNNQLCAAKPQFFYQKNNLSFFCEKDAYVMMLNNAKIFGSSNVVFVNDLKVLYEFYFYDNENKYNYTDTVILNNLNKHLSHL